MGGIFISYRRDDSRAFAEQIHGCLAERFGEDQVFFDIEDIGAGAAWADVLRDFVADPGVLVAVIGPDWVSTTDAAGKPAGSTPRTTGCGGRWGRRSGRRPSSRSW